MTTENKTIDYNIHGLVGVRLLNPSASDAAAVDRQLGPVRGKLQRDPDIVIRFERRLPLPNLRYLGLYAGFNDDGYYILRSSKAEAKVRIPFEEIGSARCEIVCESGLRSVPLLIAILNLTFLTKECIPLHASGFVYGDQGILVTGWSKGGKTEAMLAFTHNGAQYVGDEWVILAENGEKMFGLPEPVTVWDWHMQYLPEVKRKIPGNKAYVFRFVRAMERLNGLLQKSFLRNSFPARTLKESIPAFRRQMHVNFPPQKLFDDKNRRVWAPISKVFFIVSQASSEISVDSIEASEIAERMISSLEYEQSPILEHYLAYKFAFPGKRNAFIENARDLQARLLSHALSKKEAYEVRHPYPVSLHDLYEKMRPVCATSPAGKTSRRSKERAASRALTAAS